MRSAWRIAAVALAACALAASAFGADRPASAPSVASTNAVPAACGLYDYPSRHAAHATVRAAFALAVEKNDLEMMEKCCRWGLEILPGDPTWQYNLACALNRRGKTDDALAALAKAVDFGFRDAKHMASDSDLGNLGMLPPFRAIVQAAKKRAKEPVPGRPEPAEAVVAPGATVTLAKANLVWDFDDGRYVALVRSSARASKTNAVNAAAYAGPGAELLRAWLAEGTAAGNAGDVYVNRDHGHSPLATKDFPGLATIRYEEEARRKQVDRAIPNTLFRGMPVFGNASLAIVTTNDSRSLMRVALGGRTAADFFPIAYRENQFWVFPAHKDFAAATGLDRFPAVTPYALMTEGSSGTDQPYLRLALAAAAAMRPETKKAVVASRRLAPTLQWLMRRSRKGVACDDDYLSAVAHPTAFSPGDVDEKRLLEAAHALVPEAVPPVAILTALEQRQQVGLVPRPGYFLVSPCAVGVRIHATDLERSFAFLAKAGGGSEGSRTCWRVVHGDPKRLKVEPGAEPGVVELVVDCRGLTNRLDVACFAKDPGTDWGAPSIVSICGASGR